MAKKQINLGVPDEMPPGMPAGLTAAAGPGDMGGGGGGASDGGQGAQTAEPAMNYPELHASGLDPESGIEGLPDEGEAHVHYKVTDRGKRTVKHGKDKGKTKHSVSMEIHHITPTAGAGSEKESEPDQVRKSARSFFKGEDEAKQKSQAEAEPDSMMPG